MLLHRREHASRVCLASSLLAICDEPIGRRGMVAAELVGRPFLEAPGSHRGTSTGMGCLGDQSEDAPGSLWKTLCRYTWGRFAQNTPGLAVADAPRDPGQQCLRLGCGEEALHVLLLPRNFFWSVQQILLSNCFPIVWPRDVAIFSCSRRT